MHTKINIRLRFTALIILISLCCFSALFAQSDIESKTTALFGDSQIFWTRNYVGYMDEVHRADLCLAFDGFNCRGYMVYSSSETEYLLEGSLQSSKFNFVEKYQNVPSAYLSGFLEDNNIVLEWNSIDDKSSFAGVFTLVTDSPLPAANPIIVRTYTGSLDNQSVAIRLTEQHARMKGEISFADDTSQRLIGVQNADNSLSLQNQSAGYKFKLHNISDNNYQANFILPGEASASDLNLSLENELNSRSIAYLSHSTMVKCILPSMNGAFDQEIDRLVDDWTLDIERNKIRQNNNRFENRAEIWFEIDEYSKEYLSGVLYYSSTWKKDVSSKSFSYDRRSREIIAVAPFLRGSEKWDRIIRKKLIAAKELNAAEDQAEYRNWINNVSLIDPILCAKGLRFHTERSNVYGQASIVLPWAALTPSFLSPSKLTKLKKLK